MASRGASSVAVTCASFAVLVLAALRLLGRVWTPGNLLVIEVSRVAILGGGVFLAAWLAFRREGPDDGAREPSPYPYPGLGRSTIAGVVAGPVLGLLGFLVAAIPEPTDTFGLFERVGALAIGGLFFGTVLGLVGGLLFALHTTVVLRRYSEGDDAGGFSGAVLTASVLVGILGGVSAVVHGLAGEVDPVGGTMLVLAAAGFALAGEDRRWVAGLFGVLIPAIGVLAWQRNALAPDWDDTPTAIVRGWTVTDLASNDGAICGRRSIDRRLVCWGSRAGSVLGTKEKAYRTPEAHATLGAIRSVSIGGDHICTVPEAGDHRALCWAVTNPTPRPIGPPDIVEVAVGSSLTIALRGDGSVWRWSSHEPEPVVTDLRGIVHVTSTRSGPVALEAGDTFHTWETPTSSWVERRGNGRTYGARAEGPGDNSLLDQTKQLRQAAHSSGELCVLSSDGAVSCTRGNKASPNLVLSRDMVEIAGSNDGFCARSATDLWCWHGYSLAWSIFQ